VARKVLQKKEAGFILVGDGILRKQVEGHVEQWGLGGSFMLLGWRRDIPEILAATDIFVLTSLWEGLPRVLPQAMAMGIPIVATSVDGTPEAVINGMNGFLVEPRDVEAMAEKIVYLLDHSEEATTMGNRGKEMVAEFDIRKMVKEQEDLYMRLLREKGKGVQ
jgi:glycosyltransferase involved in cell wall biosynthesis